MKIELVDISSIKPYENNPRKLSEKAIEKVALSLKEYGFRQPIVVDKDNIIVAGHTRFRASKKLGLTQVPVSIIDNLTPEQINAYRIADNRVSEDNQWDFPLLNLEIEDLKKDKFDLPILGFTEEELKKFMSVDTFNPTDKDDQSQIDEASEKCETCGQKLPK